MLLKRKYTPDENGNPEVTGIEVLRVPASGKQNLSTKLVATGIAQGWLAHKKDKITFILKGKDLIMKVVQEPGRHCLHCGEKLPDDGTGAAARAHVEAAHPGADSPNPDVPSGYICPNYYSCEVA